MPFCCSLPLLLDEPLSELLLLSLLPALDVPVLTQQAGEHHRFTSFCCSTAISAFQTIFLLALRLLALMPVVDDGRFHRTPLLDLPTMEQAS